MSEKEDKGCTKCLYSVNIRTDSEIELICFAPQGFWDNCFKNGATPIEVTRMDK